MALCLFDIDGTLLSSGGAGQAAMEVALESTFGITTPTDGISVAGRTDRAIVSDLLNFHGIDDVESSWTRFVDAYLAQLPRELSARAGMILPGVEELLAGLHQREQLTLGLLTGNFRRGAELKLGHYQLAEYFSGGGFGDHHFDRDDVAREALAHMREYLAVETASEVWVIGDTPADVKCGRAINATVVAVATGMYSMDDLEATAPDHLCEDFADVELLLGLFPGE
ncbi:MAG: HAD family hydrolase [Planctomycetota bacterium]|nr:HAD family hydrolase [Planctomycetota bacterium]MDA1163144.1 HAD family hydrolase [Planctomycetota bacterium]